MSAHRLLMACMLLPVLSMAAVSTIPHASPAPGYVVIGAFASEQNAIRFTSDATKQQYNAKFEINPNRKLFYVYVLQTQDIRAAVTQAQQLRQQSPYHDTWVYVGYLGAAGGGEDLNPANGEKLAVVKQDPTPVQTVQQPVVEEKKVEEKQVEEKKTEELKPVTENPQPAEVTEAKTESLPKAEELVRKVPATNLSGTVTEVAGGKGFYFKVYSPKGEELTGEVELVDADKTKKVRTYDANKRVSIASINKSGNIHLVAQSFGYRPQQLEINYQTPTATEGVLVEQDVVVVPFEMVRLKKGDVSILYNVFFYKDAAVMRPESKYEVSSLLEMMNENPLYRIMLHGHTNGNSMGKIIEMGDDKNFFSLTNTKDGYGSSKKLSEERALVIKEFLVANGVDEKRIEVTAWGGKKPIHDKKSNKAHENVRVEVEILQD